MHNEYVDKAPHALNSYASFLWHFMLFVKDIFMLKISPCHKLCHFQSGAISSQKIHLIPHMHVLAIRVCLLANIWSRVENTQFPCSLKNAILKYYSPCND